MARTLTPKAEKLIAIVVENRLEKGKTKSKGKMMLEAGYSPASSWRPSHPFNEELFKAELQRRTEATVEAMERNKALMLEAIPKKVKDAPLNHLVNGVDTLQKNIQLLTGHATEHKAINIQISEVIAGKNTDPNVV